MSDLRGLAPQTKGGTDAPDAPDASGSSGSLLERHLDGILSHGRYPLHTGILEGINTKIKVLKRIAYGFRDEAYVFLKIRAAFPGIP